MKKFVNAVKTIYNFFFKMADDKVGIYTAQASFFIMLSLFPFALLLLNIIGLTNLSESIVVSTIKMYVPSAVEPLLVQIIDELYTHVSSATVYITAIIGIWSASKGVLSVMFGIYNIYHVHEKRNYFISRFISMIYTVLFAVIMILTLVLLVFGNKIFKLALSLVPALADITVLTIIVRYLFAFFLLTTFFTILFKMSNRKATTFSSIIPGALFASLGWMTFSYGFSIYVDNFSNMTYMYGSLTAVIMLMLWIYFCIYILFIGAEINIFLHPEIVSHYLFEHEDLYTPDKIMNNNKSVSKRDFNYNSNLQSKNHDSVYDNSADDSDLDSKSSQQYNDSDSSDNQDN